MKEVLAVYVGRDEYRVGEGSTLYEWEIPAEDAENPWVEFEAHIFGLVRVYVRHITVVVFGEQP